MTRKKTPDSAATGKANGKKGAAKRKTPRTKAAREAELKAKWITEEAGAKSPAIIKEFAREQLRRELAAWVMAFRVRFEELHKSVREVFFASRKEDHPLFGLIDSKRLDHIFSALDNIDGHLPLLTLACEMTDVLEVAKGYQDNWLTPDAKSE